MPANRAIEKPGQTTVTTGTSKKQMREKKTAIITGAGRGIGKTIAEHFLKSGYQVVACSRKKPGWSTSHADRLLRVACDVSDEQSVMEMVRHGISKFGRIHVLVNNAGIFMGGSVVEDTAEIYQKVLAVNVIGTFLTTREVLRDMYANGTEGRIINIASIAGKNAFADAGAYCASKAAVIGFTRSIAQECGPRGITANAICPGSVYTPMLEGVMARIQASTDQAKERVRNDMEASIPIRCFQAPEDIAQLCLFLASDGAKNINGEAINIDGGMVRD